MQNTLFVNSICFLQHCYMFRRLHIIIGELLMMYADVTNNTVIHVVTCVFQFYL